MNPEDVLEHAMSSARKAGAETIAAGLTRLQERMVRFSNNSITVVNSWFTETPTVYLVSDGRRAACQIEEQSVEQLDSVIEHLGRIMKVTPPGDVRFRLPRGPFKYSAVPGVFDRRLLEAETELIDLVELAVNAARKEGGERSSGVVVTRFWERFVSTSEGAAGADRGTMIEMTIRAFADVDASGQGNILATSLAAAKDEVEEAGRTAGRIASSARHPRSGTAGKYNVVLGPLIFANLLNRAADAASAYTVDLGLSFFENLLNEKVASEIFNIYDDSRYPGGAGSIALDDEGYPTAMTHLVRWGRLEGFLHTSYTAAKFKAKLTGNAIFEGGIAGMVPASRNIIVGEGDRSLNELCDMAGNGIYLTNNWYTRFQNYRTGDFSTICRDGAFEIRDGKLGGPVKGLRLSDNMLRILKSVRALSKERRWIKWWEVDTPTLTPHALVDDVSLTTAES